MQLHQNCHMKKKSSAIYNYNDVAAVCLMTWKTTMSKYINQISKEVIIIHLLLLKDIQRHKIAVCIERLLCAGHCAVHSAYILSKSLKQPQEEDIPVYRGKTKTKWLAQGHYS